MAAKKSMPFEQSKRDNDKGVKEGSKADMARDKKEMTAPGKMMMKGKGRGRK